MKEGKLKSLATLLSVILREEGDYCAIDTSHDAKSIMTRFENEGDSFLTITLPNLGAGLERALADGRATPNLFPGFRCKQNLPILLGGFFELVFDRVSGMVLDNPSIDAVRTIRQVSLFCKKIELDCTPEAIQAAYDKYVECDKEVREWELRVPKEDLTRFQRMSSLLFSNVFRALDSDIRDFSLLPRHGSGATADRLVGNYKHDWQEWTERLEGVFPFWKYATSRPYSPEVYSRVNFLEPGAERPAKVVHVPKTLVAPRIIAEEPTCMQYTQQGLMHRIREKIDRSYLVDFIGTGDQEPNQLLAKEGSITGLLATLDLSEASDRVSNLLVRTMTEHFPHLNDALSATRSTTADVQGHGVVPLARFASMGSAVTFPIETMVFLTVVMIGIEDAYHSHFTSTYEVRRFEGRVRIYGDDIIVPVDAVESVILALTRYGFVVNNAKSFWTGEFRESCGKEYLKGEDVTLVRARHLLPGSLTDCEELISAVSLMNLLYKHGLWRASRWVEQYLQGIAPIPVVSDSSTVLGRVSYLGLPSYKIGGRYQLPMVRGLVPRYRRRYTPIDGEAALQKTMLGFAWREHNAAMDRTSVNLPDILETSTDHLIYSGRPEAVALYLRNAPA